jgi:2-oxoglutarate ferredoxin oxidoreductase subunit beta
MSLSGKRQVLQAVERAKATGAREYRDNLPTWCPGCGHFTPLQSLYEALERRQVEPHRFVLVSGIGCSGRFPFFIKGFGFHALHGRALPIAAGIKMANRDLTVVVSGGDGDGVGIGGGHLPHAARMNIDITYLLLDNSIYGLTKGQTSPTSPQGMVSKTTPYGNPGRPLNPSTLAISYGATYVARVFSRERQAMTDIITEAMEHKGFSLVHIISPCVEFNRTVTYESVFDNAAWLPDDYRPDQRGRATEMSMTDTPVYQGLLYREELPTLQDAMDKAAARIG